MRITTIVVRDAQPRALPRPDQSEELSVELCHVTEIRSLIQRGRIDHGACVAGLLWWLTIGQGRVNGRELDCSGGWIDLRVPVWSLVTSQGAECEYCKAVPACEMK